MKRILFLSLSLLLLGGCASLHIHSPFGSSSNSSESASALSGGERTGTDTRFYWYTRSMTEPKFASDYIIQSDKIWYKSSYQWQDGIISEIVREGQNQQDDGSIKPFLVHLRFSNTGEAVYQRYRVDNNVMPLDQDALNRYSNDAKMVTKKVDALNDDDLTLIQGVWDGSVFDSCDGLQYSNFDYSKAAFSDQQLIANGSHYVAFVGKIDKKSLTVNQMLTLAAADHGCLHQAKLTVK